VKGGPSGHDVVDDSQVPAVHQSAPARVERECSAHVGGPSGFGQGKLVWRFLHAQQHSGVGRRAQAARQFPGLVEASFTQAVRAEGHRHHEVGRRGYFIVSFIYRHGPPVKKKWPLLTPGAIFATALMIIATLVVTYWVNNFSNYNKLYGSISAVFSLMSLIWANSLAVLLGFELDVTLAAMRLQKTESIAGSVNGQLGI
jgi:hypothetical protein